MTRQQKSKQEKKEPKSGRGSKYNWPLIKLEYFKSSILAVEDYFRMTLGLWNGNCQRHTLGWRGQKDVYIADQADLALEEFKKKKATLIADTLETMSFIVQRESKKLARSAEVNSKDVKRFWEMARTEGGMPTRITKMDMDLVPTRFDDARKAFDQKFNESSPKTDAAPAKSNESAPKSKVPRKPKSG